MPPGNQRSSFDHFYIKKFCARHLDKFAFSLSFGASGGLLTMWNSNFFEGTLAQDNAYAL